MNDQRSSSVEQLIFTDIAACRRMLSSLQRKGMPSSDVEHYSNEINEIEKSVSIAEPGQAKRNLLIKIGTLKLMCENMLIYAAVHGVVPPGDPLKK